MIPRSLASQGVTTISGAAYSHIDDDGLHLKDGNGKLRTLKVDNVVICAGQAGACRL